MHFLRKAAISVLLCAPILVSGCLTRHIREDVYKDKKIEVFLRLDKRPISGAPRSNRASRAAPDRRSSR